MEQVKNEIITEAKQFLEIQTECYATLIDALTVLKEVAGKFDNKILNKRLKTVFEEKIHDKHTGIILTWESGDIEINNNKYRYNITNKYKKYINTNVYIKDVFNYCFITFHKGKAQTEDGRIVASELINGINEALQQIEKWQTEDQKQFEALEENIAELLQTARRLETIKNQIGYTNRDIVKDIDSPTRWNIN